ncbi:hypothetical protein GGX14DRAFT_394950 [Mycena pura]|uniref:Uncharacterized protein n=1 Tax=Mycena pura TaxID=153505 RepID=A0AAD6YHF5_9AGAR|nr:hypothetical protein GGX14DRAFT_394950 [Mycena pura]
MGEKQSTKVTEVNAHWRLYESKERGASMLPLGESAALAADVVGESKNTHKTSIKTDFHRRALQPYHNILKRATSESFGHNSSPVATTFGADVNKHRNIAVAVRMALNCAPWKGLKTWTEIFDSATMFDESVTASSDVQLVTGSGDEPCPSIRPLCQSRSRHSRRGGWAVKWRPEPRQLPPDVEVKKEGKKKNFDTVGATARPALQNLLLGSLLNVPALARRLRVPGSLFARSPPTAHIHESDAQRQTDWIGAVRCDAMRGERVGRPKRMHRESAAHHRLRAPLIPPAPARPRAPGAERPHHGRPPYRPRERAHRVPHLFPTACAATARPRPHVAASVRRADAHATAARCTHAPPPARHVCAVARPTHMRRRPPDAHAQPPARRPSRFRHALLLPDGHLPPSPGTTSKRSPSRALKRDLRARDVDWARARVRGEDELGRDARAERAHEACHFVRHGRRGHGLGCGGGLGRRRGGHEEKATIDVGLTCVSIGLCRRSRKDLPCNPSVHKCVETCMQTSFLLPFCVLAQVTRGSLPKNAKNGPKMEKSRSKEWPALSDTPGRVHAIEFLALAQSQPLNPAPPNLRPLPVVKIKTCCVWQEAENGGKKETMHGPASEHCVPKGIPARASLSRLCLGPQLPYLTSYSLSERLSKVESEVENSQSNSNPPQWATQRYNLDASKISNRTGYT